MVAYLAAGTFILACLLSALFLIGERMDVVQGTFAPIALAAALVFAGAWWGLTVLGVGAWWMWRGQRPRERGSDEPPRDG